MNLARAFSNIAATVGAPFVDAVAVWAGEPAIDNGGSIIAAGEAASFACRAQFDAPTQQVRAAEGFKQTDVRILVLAGSIVRPLDTGARIMVASGANAGTWSILSCQRDAAGLGFECLGRLDMRELIFAPLGDYVAPDASDGLSINGNRMRVDIDELPSA
jgi:hypothetical protein